VLFTAAARACARGAAAAGPRLRTKSRSPRPCVNGETGLCGRPAPCAGPMCGPNAVIPALLATTVTASLIALARGSANGWCSWTLQSPVEALAWRCWLFSRRSFRFISEAFIAFLPWYLYCVGVGGMLRIVRGPLWWQLPGFPR
jgi:hypothetical protein